MNLIKKIKGYKKLTAGKRVLLVFRDYSNFTARYFDNELVLGGVYQSEFDFKSDVNLWKCFIILKNKMTIEELDNFFQCLKLRLLLVVIKIIIGL